MKKLFAVLLIALLSVGEAYSVDPDDVNKAINGIGSLIKAVKKDKSESSSRSKRNRNDGKLKAESDIEGLVVKVKSCKADANDNVEIVFIIENTLENDTRVTMQGFYSEVYDDEGNVYNDGKSISYAQSKDPYQSRIYANVPAGIPVKFKMRIKDVDPEAAVLTKVVVGRDIASGFDIAAKMYNVPITREGD